MTHGERAEALFEQGYNCAQAVFCAFADDAGIDGETAARIASCFGGGIARQRHVCGAVSGMCMAYGLIGGCSGNVSKEEKAALYEKTRSLCDAFRRAYGSILCSDLLGQQAQAGGEPSERTPQFYGSRPCSRFVRFAADLLEQELSNR